ncbi:LAMI_0H01024g1_1 [Lachancea mirantina]|uniref:LAMI_0H01024g1_1 n=1 Tax=Lachancea mirantina TaxID=1230905 RepID=A0A1G4KDL4_9SACH|nr:LAMI_0H01024g1_1 [Lachancea mirantina]
MSSGKVSYLVEKTPALVNEVEGQSDEGPESYDGSLNQYREPTGEESRTLRRIIGYPKWYVYLICLIEFAERASYYGTGDRLSNFIQRPLPTGGSGTGAVPAGSGQSAGALNMGLQAASGLTLLLTFLAYCFPLITGYLSDRYLGRMKMLWMGVITGVVSHIIFVIGAIPSVLKNGNSALAPCVIGIITLAIATSFIKPVLLPTLLSQYPHETDVVKTLKSGELVVVDRDASLQRMTMTFYWSINFGAFVSLGTAYCAKDIGYWLAYLIPLIIYLIMPIVLIFLRRHIKDEPPSGYSLLADCCKVLSVCLEGNWIRRYRDGEFWEYARPSNLRQMGRNGWRKNKPGFYAESLVSDTKATMSACAIFLYYVIYNINDGGIGAIVNNQTASMDDNGVPNDLINNFNPLAIIISMPLLDWIVYPIFRRFKINFKPVYRITAGFFIASMASLAGAIIQYRIYQTSSCGWYATNCANDGTAFSPISMWEVVSEYTLTGFSECLAMTTGYELAFERSPTHMKSFVMALFLFTSALSAALGEIVTPSLQDPHLIIPFAVLTGLGVLFAAIFLWRYWDLDKIMEIERQERLLHERTKEKMPIYSSHVDELESGIEHVLSITSAAQYKDQK